MIGAAVALLAAAAALPDLAVAKAVQSGADGVPVRGAVLISGDVTAADYPSDLAQAGVTGRTFVRYRVGTSGTPSRCRVTTSSGNAVLDARTCEVVARFRYRPAADHTGRPLPQWFTFGITWAPQLELDGPEPVRSE